jgi:hypothetical protein
MSITFNWSISKMQVIPEQDSKTNVVVKAEWLVKAVDKDNNAASFASGTCNFSLGNTFTPFEELTEQQVLNWCFALENFKINTEAQVTEKIERQLAQKAKEPALPWAQIEQLQ